MLAAGVSQCTQTTIRPPMSTSSGLVVVVNLHGPVMREVLGPCSEHEARRVLDLLGENSVVLLEGLGAIP